jgi:hypothetical protein
MVIRFVLGGTLLAIAIMIIAASAIQEPRFASPSLTTSVTTGTQSSVSLDGASPPEDQYVSDRATTTVSLNTQIATQTSHGNGTIGVYYQVANYSIVPVSEGLPPVFLSSHDDLYIPMHVMNWYTVSCGTKYNITGTIYWYDYYPPYSGVGNLEVYTNIARGEMTGAEILAFNSTGTTSISFTSIFAAC